MDLQKKFIHVNKTLFVFQRWLDVDSPFSMLTINQINTSKNTFDCRLLDKESDSVLEMLKSGSGLVSKESNSSPLGIAGLEEPGDAGIQPTCGCSEGPSPSLSAARASRLELKHKGGEWAVQEADKVMGFCFSEFEFSHWCEVQRVPIYILI